MSSFRHILPILVAVLFTLPGVGAALAHVELSPPLTALMAGSAILAASFLLLWACDAAQADVSQSMALAAVALIAVLPEYAVSMYFTWQAGRHPEGEHAHYALANMTGANRLIIGLGWAVIAAIFWFRTRGAVAVGEDRRLEVRFLAAATLYAFVIPIKGSLAWYDGVVLIGMFVWYIIIAGGRPQTDPDAEGPGEYIAKLPKVQRRTVTVALLLFSAAVIVTNAEHFCEGLVATGKLLNINEFFLVQWLAPIASEAPEFVVATMFALRGRAGLALGSLISSKLNQWTLLVGMIPGVYALSAKTLAHPIPMDGLQMDEILLTAAQSLLAVVMLLTLRLSIAQAGLLFVLFTGQLVAPPLVHQLAGGEVWGLHADQMHPLFSLFYLIAAVALIADRPERLTGLWRRSRGSPDSPD
jgi:cation:H+ antiporter